MPAEPAGTGVVGFEHSWGDIVAAAVAGVAVGVELVPRINSGSITIPNDPTTLRELRGWERKRGYAGRDRVDHRPGAHDEAATALALAAYLAGSAEEFAAAVPDISMTRVAPFGDAGGDPWR